MSSRSTGPPPEITFAHPADPQATIEVIELGRLRRMEILDHSIQRPHRIEFFQLLVVVDGRGRHRVDFVDYPVERGTVLQMRPGQVQAYDAVGAFEGLVLLFVPTSSALRLPRPRWPTRVTLPEADFGILVDLVTTLLRVEGGTRRVPQERLRRLLLPAVLEIVEGASLHQLDRGRQRLPVLEAFDALVEEHYAVHRDLAWYTRQLGCSVRTLTRKCRQLTGQGAKRRLDERVVLEAKRRLIADDTSVEALAHALGFSEATNFVKFFRRHTGWTPNGFRQSDQRLDATGIDLGHLVARDPD